MLNLIAIVCIGAPRLDVRAQTITVSLETRKQEVTFVRAPLNGVRVKVGIAKDRVGSTESLVSISARHGALAAINGCFFDAYSNRPKKNIDQTVITEGRFLHIGSIGTVAGFRPDGTARIERAKWAIDGGTDDSWEGRKRWYAYWMNRLPTSDTGVIVYTPDWGTQTEQEGLQAVIDQGRVTWIGSGSMRIPPKGFVVLFKGSETRLRERFEIGRAADIRVRLTEGDVDFWSGVTEAIGCGPTLVEGGRVRVVPEAEGFSSPKILSSRAARSALGLTRDGQIVLATTTATVFEFGKIMHRLGCQSAMNLDGGASSGLVVNGKTIRKPGRAVANALLLLPK